MNTEALPLPEGRPERPVAPSPLAWVKTRLREPLYRNGYALVASSMLTSALGLAYWLLAAREYSPAAVGVCAALISAMTLIANLAQLNLKSALNRFLPRAGTTAERLVTRSYLVALVVSGLASMVFVAGIGLWTPKLEFLADRPELVVLFVTGTMAWTIFVLQDSVLAGIRQAVWVPVENTVYAVAKIVLLVLLVAAAPTLGVFVSWTLPILALIVPVNILLFRRLIPAHVRKTSDREEPVGARQVARYAAADYTAYLIWAGTGGVLPLIVLQVAGAAANAYFYVSWTIAYSLYLISSGMGMAMITEASLDPQRLAAHRRRAVVESARLVVPAVLIVVAAAPLILGLMGQDYSDEGATLLRLLALSAVPFILVAAYTNEARVEQRMRVVVWTYTALCALVFAIGLPLLATIGIVGLGIAWLAAQCAVAAFVGIRYLGLDLRSAWGTRALRIASGARDWVRSHRHHLGSSRSREAIVEGLRQQRGEAWGWKVRGHVGTLNDVAVSLVGPPGRKPVALLKQACSAPAEQALRGEELMLHALNDDQRLAGWRGLVPQVLSAGHDHGRRFLVQTRLPGISSEKLLANGLSSAKVVAAAEAAIEPLHEATVAETEVDPEMLREWIDVPVAMLRPVVARRSGLGDAEAQLERLAAELREAFDGRRVATSWVHGDLCPGNVLLTSDGETATGLVDWERGGTRGLPQTDLIHLWMTTKMEVEKRELGDVVLELVGGWAGSGDKAPSGNGDQAAYMRGLVLLAWLHHAAGNVSKSNRYPRSRTWVRRNLDPVLATIGPAPVPAMEPPLPEPGAAPASLPGQQRLPRPLLPRPRLPQMRDFGARLHEGRAAIAALPREVLASVGAMSLAVLLWALSLGSIDPREMTEVGLMAVLPITFFVALALLTVSFAVMVHRQPQRKFLLGAHVVALIAFIHATPAIVYGTLRYSWAWKHLGVVDYIQRHGGVKPDIRFLDIYHNWPGFFGLDALLGDLAGLPNLIELASWAPFFFNLLFFGAIAFVFTALTRNKRVLWLGIWLFFTANWVGQDYFSPQAFAFLLYLLVIGIVLRWPSPPPGYEFGRRWRGVRALVKRLPRTAVHDEPETVDRWLRGATIVLAILMLAAIAVSHALTSVMIIVALGALVVFRVTAARGLPLIAAAIAGLWMALGAVDYVTSDVGSTLESVRLPWTTTESSVSSAGQFSDGQAVVAILARSLVVAMIVLALVGVVVQLRSGRLSRAAVILATVPLLMFGVGDYGGEVLFRIYLFSLPFMAFLAAYALLHPWGEERSRSPELPLLTAASCLILLAGMLFAYYGKERQFYFTPNEVAASEYLYTNAPDNSLLIQGSFDYPVQFKNYERFFYVGLSREPPASQARFIAHPVSVLSDWMSDPQYRASFLIITRSQKAEINGLGEMPRGSLGRIERALGSSPRFDVVLRNRDAVIFTLAKREEGRST